MNGGPAGVGISHAAGDGPGRQECRLQGLHACGGVGIDLDHLRSESRVENAQLGVQAAADPVQDEAAIGVGRYRLRPARQIVHTAPPAVWSFPPVLDGLCEYERWEAPPDRRDRDHRARNGLALHVEELALNDLLRHEPDLGRWLILAGVEIGPAHSVAGCQRGRAELGMMGRRGAGRIEPEPARRAARPVTGRRREGSFGIGTAEQELASQGDGNRRVGHRLALRVEDAANDEHPARGRSARLGRGRLDPSDFRSWLAFPRLRRSLEPAAQIPRRGGDGAEEQDGHRQESQPGDQHGSEHLLSQGRRRGDKGLSGCRFNRKPDRSPGRHVAQGG